MLDMKKSHPLPLLTVTGLAAAVATLGSGCASSSPPPPPPSPAYSQYPKSYPAEEPRNPNNTARGAVAGAVAGAVLGGVIGNNSDHGNTEKGAAIGAVAGGIAGAAIGHHVDQRESADTGYAVQTVPPLPGPEPYETVPLQPAQQAVWIRGHYDYVGNGYQWQPGRWEIPPGGARTYIGPSWQPAARGGYVYVRGHWQ